MQIKICSNPYCVSPNIDYTAFYEAAEKESPIICEEFVNIGTRVFPAGLK